LSFFTVHQHLTAKNLANHRSKNTQKYTAIKETHVKPKTAHERKNKLVMLMYELAGAVAVLKLS